MTDFFDESSLAPPVLKDQPKPTPPTNVFGPGFQETGKKSGKRTTSLSPYAQAAMGSNNTTTSPGGKKKKNTNNASLSKDSVRSLNALETHEKRKDKNNNNNNSSGNNNNTHNSNVEVPAVALETAQELQEESDEINELVEAQRTAAAEGRFLDAHYFQKRVKDAAKSHQQHVDNDLHYSKMNAILSSREVTHSHKEKMMIFTAEWEKQLGELERKAAEERNNLSQRHQRELAEQEEIVRGQIAARWQNVKSKALTEAHQTTQRLASQQFYYEAHQAQVYAEKLEAKEQAEKEAKFQRELTRRMNALKTAKAKEMSALESRIDSAREALLTQRARDYEVLVLKQYNRQVTDEQRVRVDFGKKRTEVQRKMIGTQTRLGKKATQATLPPLSGTSTMNSQQQQQHSRSLAGNNYNNNSVGRSGSANGNKRKGNNSSSSSTFPVGSSSTGGGGVLNTVGISYAGKDDLPLPITAASAQQHVPRPPSGSK